LLAGLNAVPNVNKLIRATLNNTFVRRIIIQYLGEKIGFSGRLFFGSLFNPQANNKKFFNYY
jgi:hypothetical protein